MSAAQDTISRFVAATYPDEAKLLVDHVATVMTGLSAMAREGAGVDRLLGIVSRWDDR